MFWLLVAPLTQLAQAEAPEYEEEVDEVREALPEFKRYAYDKTTELFGSDEWEYVDFIVRRESSWNNKAQNPTSTAFGYFQFLNGTWNIVGCIKTSDAYVQVDCGLAYIKQRYGTPQKAYEFWKINHWY